MKHALYITLAVLMLLAHTFAADSQPQQAADQFVANVFYPAVALLYREDWQGNMHFTCTVTAFEKKQGVLNDTYRFVTASHCVSENSTSADKTTFFIAQEGESKNFIRAKVLAFGNQNGGDDFSVLEVHTRDHFTLMPLGDDPTSVAGEPVVNVAAPLGLGKQVFEGRVTSPRMDRPEGSDDFDWTGTILLQLYGTNGGSSGSAVECVNQRAICGFVVGIIGNSSIVAMPVSRFKKFWADEQAHNYAPVSPTTGEKVN